MSQKKICSIKECDGTIVAKDLCKKHYSRMRKYSDPLKVMRYVGKGNTREERFWSRVNITNNPNDCWNWTAGTNFGYGQLKFNKRPWRAHRLAWFLTYGNLDESLLVRHFKCDNPACCNPHHLKVGTQKDNVADKMSKNRQAKGESQGNAKLKDNDVKKVWELSAEGKSGYVIARIFNVRASTIHRILRGKNWRHIKSARQVLESQPDLQREGK